MSLSLQTRRAEGLLQSAHLYASVDGQLCAKPYRLLSLLESHSPQTSSCSSRPISSLASAHGATWVERPELLPGPSLYQLRLFSSDPKMLIHLSPAYPGTMLRLAWHVRGSPNVERIPPTSVEPAPQRQGKQGKQWSVGIG